MKKIINLGEIDYEGKGKKQNLVTIDFEYKEKKEGQKVLSISGNIWNKNKSDILAGGQMLDDLVEYFFNTSTGFKDVHRLWKLYHLNDMHPECKHQKNNGWEELASEKVDIYTFSLTTEGYSKKREVEKEAMEKLKKGENVKLTQEEIKRLSLVYDIKTHQKELNDAIKDFYTLEKTEIKTLGWLREEEHPQGLLLKKCEVCGYKYGSKWNYVAIPEADEKIIYKIIGDDKHE